MAHQKRGADAHHTTSRYAEIIARWVIGIYSIATILTLFTWIISPLRRGHGFTWWEITASLLNIPSSHTLVSAVIMVVMTSALITRKRAALYAVIFFQVIGILIGTRSALLLFFPDNVMPSEEFFSSTLDTVAIIVAAIFIPLLILARSAFPAHIGRISWVLASMVFLGGLTVTTLLAWYFGHHVPGVTVPHLLKQGLGLDSFPELKGANPGATVVGAASVFYGIFALIAVYVVVRGYRVPNTWTADRELRLRELLQEYGGNDSLSYFATRRDKQVIFSADMRAAVTYRQVGSVCLASSDPVGDPASWGSAIDRWMHQVRRYGWIPAAISVSKDGARAFARRGLGVIRMGDEAILEASRFSLNNTSLTEVRHAHQRVRKAGYTLKIFRHRELSPEQLHEVENNVNAWRHGKVERGFSMALNRLSDPADGRNLLVSAHDSAGTMVALLSFVPWGRTGISLDVMRRSPDSPNGIVEYMVAQLMEDAPDYGITRVSLNFAMFRHVYENADQFGANAWSRFASRSLGVLDRFLQLERLYRFNLKFAPEWMPRYMVAEPTLAFLNVAAAAGVAEGFLPDFSARKQRHEVHRLTEDQIARVHEIERMHPGEAQAPEHRFSDQTKHRIRHLQMLRDAGMNPYPLGVTCEYSTVQVHDGLSGHTLPSGEFTMSGRVRFIRNHGGVIFLTLSEEGKQVQIIAERSLVSEREFQLLKSAVDTGDILLVTGTAGASRTGTASVIVHGWQMAAKCLHPIPYGALNDPEARIRKRSTDLLVHPQQLENLRMRSSLITAIRRTLDDAGFTEVETPILNTIHGGASARPFKTFINAYGADLTLRIAPELYLKRLVVGGLGAVYELGRDFRNEGADATHNPEFTVLEAYKPYADYTVMRKLTETLIKNAARAVYGSEVLPLGEKGSTERTLTDVSGEWRAVSVCEALSRALGRDISSETDFETLLELAHEHQIHVRDDMGAGAILEELYGELVEAKTVFPTFYTDFPVETSPLAGAHRTKPHLVERWDLVINGMEMGTAYSEMTDALEQRRRLTEQSLKAAAGDPEAMQIDEDFLYALETGLVPTGGLGIGIDRLAMLMAQTQIRGVLSFPFVKPVK